MQIQLPHGRRACRIAQMPLMLLDDVQEPAVAEATPNKFGVLMSAGVIHRYSAPSNLKRGLARFGFHGLADDYLELQFARHAGHWYWSASAQFHGTAWGALPRIGGERRRTARASSFSDARHAALEHAGMRLRERASPPWNDQSAEAAARLLGLIEAGIYLERIF